MLFTAAVLSAAALLFPALAVADDNPRNNPFSALTTIVKPAHHHH